MGKRSDYKKLDDRAAWDPVDGGLKMCSEDRRVESLRKAVTPLSLREAKDKYVWNCLHSKVRIRARLISKFMDSDKTSTWLARVFEVNHCIVL